MVQCYCGCRPALCVWLVTAWSDFFIFLLCENDPFFRKLNWLLYFSCFVMVRQLYRDTFDQALSDKKTSAVTLSFRDRERRGEVGQLLCSCMIGGRWACCVAG